MPSALVATLPALVEIAFGLMLAAAAFVFLRTYGVAKAKDALIDTLQSTVTGLQAEVASLTRQLSEANLKVKHLEDLRAADKDRHTAEMAAIHSEFDARMAQTQAETIKYRNQVSVLVEILRKGETTGAQAAEVIGQIMAREDEQDRLASTSVEGGHT